jgi:aminopeptidase N
MTGSTSDGVHTASSIIPPNANHGALTGEDPYLPGSGNGGYRVSGYNLDLDYKVRTNRLEATAIVTATSTQKLSRLSLDLAGLVVSKVSVNGTRVAKFSQRDDKVIIKPASPLAADQQFTVMIRYSGFPHPAQSAWGDVGWEELADGVLVAGQPCGASTWFPCDDQPSAKAAMYLRITCDSPYFVQASGTAVSRVARGHRTVWVYEATEPVAPYLATVQIGMYGQRPLAAGPVQQRLLTPDSLADQAAHDFELQPRMMDTFVELFGDYPFAEYTSVVTDDELEIPLEAHGLAVFGRNHIDGAGSSERLIAHELAHQWFGNSVTAGQWSDIWLHEGFACYAEWLWSERKGSKLPSILGKLLPINSRSADEHARHHRGRLAELPQDLVLRDPGADLMFDDRVYKRGALVLHALRLTVGDNEFFPMLRAWTSEHRFGSVSTDDFIAHAQAHTNVPVEALLHEWLDEVALPELPSSKVHP